MDVLPKENRKQQARQPSFDSREQEVYLQLWKTYDCLKAVEEELFDRFELSAQQYNALRLLQAADPAGTRTMELGRRLISRSPDMTRMLDRLARRGLIYRQRHAENRRVVEVFITEAGRRLLDQMAETVVDMHDQQLGHLNPTEQRQLVRLLKLARRPHENASCDWLQSQASTPKHRQADG